MPQLDAIKQIAQQTLTFPALTGHPDSSLWNRAQRLTRIVEHICRLPELVNSGLQIDHLCLNAAAYFCEAGLAGYANSQNSAPLTVADVNTDEVRNLSVQIVTEKLSAALPSPKVDKINKIITESGNRFTKMTEAIILSDARNIDDMGAVGLFNEFRQYVIHGQGVSDALQSWKRKVDCRYWHARLKETFRLQAVRTLAAQRLSAAECFMEQLFIENTVKDLEELITKSFDENKDT